MSDAVLNVDIRLHMENVVLFFHLVSLRDKLLKEMFKYFCLSVILNLKYVIMPHKQNSCFIFALKNQYCFKDTILRRGNCV